MKALVERDKLMKKHEIEMRKAPHFFYLHLSRELKGTQGNLKEALVEEMEGKKLRKRGKEVKFHKSEKKKEKT